jgi:hypothetical protein
MSGQFAHRFGVVVFSDAFSQFNIGQLIAALEGAG